MDMTQGSHSLFLGGNPDGMAQGFDFDPFLQDAEMDYLGMSRASSGTTSPPSPHAMQTPQANSSSSSNALADVARRGTGARQRLERRGHTKSRRGCYNCKRRRIKCQETRPACGHCVKTGLQCEYPALPQIVHQPHHQIPLFSLQDMRCFQHFLLNSYPAHPFGNERIWTHEVPCLSHNHEYLMHAILGCAASDLAKQTSQQELVLLSLTHRFRAIRAIKKRLADMPRTGTTYDEANAMLATCFALTFQSTALDDGLAEFMTFIRGIVIVGMQMWLKGIKPLFVNLESSDQENMVVPHMENLPLISSDWSEMAINSLENIRGLCQDPLQVEYHNGLMVWAQQLLLSSVEAYRRLRKQYAWWMMQPHDRFQRLIDLNEQVMILLATHWVSLQTIMVFILENEHLTRAKEPPPPANKVIDPGMCRWLKFLNPLVDDEHRVYNEFPVWVEEQMDRDVTFFGKSM